MQRLRKKKDNRVESYHQDNCGPSVARNLGITKATGKYIVFVDSDDIIHRKMVCPMVGAIIKDDGIGVSCCNFACFSDTIYLKSIFYLIMKLFRFFNFLKRKYGFLFVLNYTRQIFLVIFSLYGKLHEDEFLTYKLCYAAKKIVWTDDKFYSY